MNSVKILKIFSVVWFVFSFLLLGAIMTLNQDIVLFGDHIRMPLKIAHGYMLFLSTISYLVSLVLPTLKISKLEKNTVAFSFAYCAVFRPLGVIFSGFSLFGILGDVTFTLGLILVLKGLKFKIL